MSVITFIPLRGKSWSYSHCYNYFLNSLSGLWMEINRSLERGETARNTEDFLHNLPAKASVPPCEPILQRARSPFPLLRERRRLCSMFISHVPFHLVMHLAYLPHSNNEENLCIKMSQNNRSSLHRKATLLKWAQEQFLFCSLLFYSHLFKNTALSPHTKDSRHTSSVWAWWQQIRPQRTSGLWLPCASLGLHQVLGLMDFSFLPTSTI